jgi:hypothetical protein
MRAHPRSLVRLASLLAGAGLVTALTAPQVGCSGVPAGDSSPTAPESTGSSDATGSVGAELTLPGGEVLSSASWVITGPGGASTIVAQGTVNLQGSQTLAFTVSGIPAGSGYAVSVSGTTTDGTVTCAGSAPFSVASRQTTNVTVLLPCGVSAPEAGALSVGTQIYTCAAVSGVSATPSETTVGSSIALTGTATGPAPSALTYAWSAPSGSFSMPGAASTNFTCTALGPVTATLTVSDGTVPAGGSCAPLLSTSSVQLQCDSGDAGALDAGAPDASVADSGPEAGSDAQGSDGSAVPDASADAGPADTGASDAGPVIQDVVVYRVGDGTAGLLNTGDPVFVDEFNPTTGVRVKSTAMPTVTNGSNHRLIASGTATSEGLMTTSVDGRYVVLTGYDSPIPFVAADGGISGVAGTTSAQAARVVGRLDAAGNVDTTTALTDFVSGNNPRGVVTMNGTTFWVAGAADSVHLAALGSSTSTALATNFTNLRAINIFGGQLYVSSSSGALRLGTVGTGVPTTSGQTITQLPGFPTAGSPYSFFFADLDGNPGLDTVYVADDTNGTPGGLTKYALVGGSWTAKGTVGAAADAYRGVTGVVSGTSVTLYAVRKGGSAAAGGGELVTIVDASGYNGAFAGTPSLLAAAATDTAFRGVALAPHP